MSTIVKLRTEWAHKEPITPATKRVIIIDDQSVARTILEAIICSIESNIDVKKFGNPLEAISWSKLNVCDLILVDYKMSELDGIETIRRLRNTPSCVDVPIVMVTISDDKTVCRDAFDAGATDFLVKPFDEYECRARCRNLLTLREQNLLLQDRTKLLEFEIACASRQMRARERETVMLAANLSEYHAHQNGFRIIRIAGYAGLIAEGMSLSPEMVERIELASTLHDVGKIGIADDILLCEGNLTAVQEQALREHTEIGHMLLEFSSSENLKMAAEICLSHHERFDGQGYPNGLKGRNIPLSARIVAVAVAFDLLTFPQVTHSIDQVAAAMSILMSRKYSEFDPDCVEALGCQLGKTSEILGAYADPV